MSFPAFQTPQRPLPGAFVQTPAPSRFPGPGPNRQLFRAQSSNPTQGSSALTLPGAQPSGLLASSQPQSQAVGGLLPTVQPQSQPLKPVQRAGRTINEVLRKDANFPELDSYVKRKLCGCPAEKTCTNPPQRASLPTMRSLLL